MSSAYLLRFAPAAPPNLPKLPIEIWERVLDFVAERNTALSRFARKDLLSCCLVCQAWVPRCRFYLSGQITIRSNTELTRITEWLARAPKIRAHVRELTLQVEAGADADHYWMSLVPMRLPKLENLGVLTFRDVDLCKRYPTFYKAYALFRLNKLIFTGVQCLHLSQLERIAAITRATVLETENCVDLDFKGSRLQDDPTNVAARRSGRLKLDRGRLAKASITKRTWENLSKLVSRGWELSLLSEEFLKIAPAWQDGDGNYREMEYRDVWRDIVSLYQVVCGVKSELKGKPTVMSEQRMRQLRWIAAVTGITLPQNRRELRLEIKQGASPASVPHLLSALSPAQFQTVSIYVDGGDFTSWFSFWKPIDDVLAHADYADLGCVKLYFYSNFTGLPDGYECEVELIQDLLPQAAKRNILDKCFGDCRYHTAPIPSSVHADEVHHHLSSDAAETNTASSSSLILEADSSSDPGGFDLDTLLASDLVETETHGEMSGGLREYYFERISEPEPLSDSEEMVELETLLYLTSPN